MSGERDLRQRMLQATFHRIGRRGVVFSRDIQLSLRIPKRLVATECFLLQTRVESLGLPCNVIHLSYKAVNLLRMKV